MKHESVERPVDPITVRVKDACRMTGIGRSKLYELIETGEIATFKVGTMTLIPVASIRRFLLAKGMTD
jgi:excisionase family DNA binding protein